MKTLWIVAALAFLSAAGPAFADHLQNLETPYASRGACESAVADFNSNDRDMLLDRFPNFFSNEGEVASFLTRAFPCELNDSNGQWYIQDRRLEVLTSDWYLRRQ
jgi:hypothetical protein